VLAENGNISVKDLADKAFMSETTAARCKEAWDAVIAALIEVGEVARPGEGCGEEGDAETQGSEGATRRSRPNAVRRAERHRCRHRGRGGILIRLSSKDMPPVGRSGAFLWGLRTGLLPCLAGPPEGCSLAPSKPNGYRLTRLLWHQMASLPGQGHLCVEPELEAHGLSEPRRLWRNVG
jgi:hypothetical protein